MKYAWIKAESEHHDVTLLCSLVEVTRSAYYAWLKAVVSPKAKQDAEIKTLIQVIFSQNHAVYGTRRLKKVLHKQGSIVSRWRIGRLMQEAKLRCKTKRRFKATTNSKHNLPIAANQLERQFKVEEPNKVYVGDITYIPTREG